MVQNQKDFPNHTACLKTLVLFNVYKALESLLLRSIYTSGCGIISIKQNLKKTVKYLDIKVCIHSANYSQLVWSHTLFCVPITKL